MGNGAVIVRRGKPRSNTLVSWLEKTADDNPLIKRQYGSHCSTSKGIPNAQVRMPVCQLVYKGEMRTSPAAVLVGIPRILSDWIRSHPEARN